VFQSSVPADPVLIVDDAQDVSASLASVLEQAGIDVVVASGADDAFVLQEQHHPAVVVVDHNMADRSGVKLALRLRDRDPDAPVLVVAHLSSLDEVLPLSTGIYELLIKPLVPKVFVQTVRNALHMRALSAENRRLAARTEPPVVAADGDGHPLAGPPEREQFEARLGDVLAGCRREGGALAVLLVELDGWQALCDRYGPGTAASALPELARRLVTARRKTDIVARVERDRFGVVCPGIGSAVDAYRAAGLIVEGSAVPVVVDGVEHWLRATIGIALSGPDSPEKTSDQLLDEAEAAMCAAKRDGRPMQVFDPSLGDRESSRRSAQREMRSAIENGEFMLVYQPVVDLQTGQVVGAEALLRWQRGEHDVMLPGAFLPAGEALGLSEEIGRWVFKRGLSELAALREEHSLPEHFHLDVNVSAQELRDPQFAQNLEELMAEFRIPATMVTLDLANRPSGEPVPDHALERLGQTGVRFSLDDFGTGELSLSWLNDLPIAALKIAPVLVASLDGTGYDPRRAALVRAFIALGHELHLSLVAEGVETPAQAAALRAMGCEFAQGYHFGRPGPRDHVLAPVGV
jgi:diguanylate cyclase (GGDEF)-like protein